jgi:hypothetical protein
MYVCMYVSSSLKAVYRQPTSLSCLQGPLLQTFFGINTWAE